MTDKFDVVTFGEAMAMFVALDEGELHKAKTFTRLAAGAELNVAIGLSRLGFNVGWQSRLGNDSSGRYILELLKKEKINTTCVVTDLINPTGFLLKSKAKDGADPEVEYFRKGSAASKLSLDDFVNQYFDQAKHLHLTGVAAALSQSSYSYAHHLAEYMRSMGKSISFDPNLRPTLWESKEVMVERINALAFKCDYFLPGIGEGKILTNRDTPDGVADFYLEQGVQIVAVKLGIEGAYYKNSKGESGVVPSFPVKVVDTVGAGDGFAVGVISGLLENLSLEASITRGNKIGSLAIQVIGDSDGLPTREELGGY